MKAKPGEVIVILEPPYMVKYGTPRLATYVDVKIYVDGMLVKEFPGSSTSSTKKTIEVELFQLRALARNKNLPCMVKIVVNKRSYGPEYIKASEKNHRKAIDITDWFPVPFHYQKTEA